VGRDLGLDRPRERRGVGVEVDLVVDAVRQGVKLAEPTSTQR
jgi:hypothetical protein